MQLNLFDPAQFEWTVGLLCPACRRLIKITSRFEPSKEKKWILEDGVHITVGACSRHCEEKIKTNAELGK